MIIENIIGITVGIIVLIFLGLTIYWKWFAGGID